MRTKNPKKKFKFLQFLFYCPLSPVLSLFGHNFCSWAPIVKKIIFLGNESTFLSSKNVSKNQDKISAHRYLPKIPFVPQRDNSPLEVNN